MSQMPQSEGACSFSAMFGEFKDRKLEEEFLKNEFNIACKYVRPLAFIMGFLFFLFVIPDYYLIRNKQIFYTILASRALFLLLIVLLCFKIKEVKHYSVMVKWFTVYKIIISCLYLFIFYIYEAPNFLIQTFGIITIIIVFFLVPNRWINLVVISSGFCISFFLLAFLKLQNIKPNEFSAAVVFTFLIILLNSISSYRINYYKRLYFQNSQRLLKVSVTDALTGIFNRGKFDKELKKWVAISKRYNSPLSLVLFDLDNLKNINDTYGHLVSDKVLVGITKLVLKIIRETDIFARWGGDEFMLLLPNTQEQQAVQLAKRIRISIYEHDFDVVGQVSCSFGVVSLKKDDDITSFFHRADIMLYSAKNSGKNVVISKNFPEFLN